MNADDSVSPVSPLEEFPGFVQHADREGAAADAVERRADARVADAAAADDAADMAAEAADAARAAARATAAADRAADFARLADPTTAGESTFLYTTGARSAAKMLDRHTRTNLPGGSRSKSKKYKGKNTLKTRKCSRRNRRNRRSRRSRNHKLHH